MPKNILDPLVIAQLGNLQLRARRILDGLYSGHHVNLNRGHAQDFSEHRPYNPGDDLKGLDWKIFGRTDRLVIKQYEEQTSVGALVLIDDSASMGFSWGGRLSKLEYAKTMAAALGYLVVSQHDAVGLATQNKFLRAQGAFAHLDRYFGELEKLAPKDEWNVDEMMQTAGRNIKKKSFVIVLSDLMTDFDKLINSLRILHAHKHEVLVFQVMDPAEITLPFNGPVVFKDAETQEELKTEPDAIREAYKKVVDGKLSLFSHLFRSSGIDYLFLTTDASFEKGLGAYLSWREARL